MVEAMDQLASAGAMDITSGAIEEVMDVCNKRWFMEKS